MCICMRVYSSYSYIFYVLATYDTIYSNIYYIYTAYILCCLYSKVANR